MTATFPHLIDGDEFSNVNGGSTATCEVATDGVYTKLELGYVSGATPVPATEAVIADELELIRLKVNGKPQQEYTAAQIIAWLKSHGRTIRTGFLNIPFSLPWMKTIGGQDYTRWGTADINTFHVEVKLKAGVQNPSLKLRYVKDMFNEPMGQILKFRNQVLGVTSTGLRTETNLDKIPRYLQWLFFMGGANDINSINIELDRRTIWEATAAQQSEHLAEYEFIEQPNVFMVPFNYRKRSFEYLDPFVLDGQGRRVRPHNSFVLELDMAAANDINMMQVIIGQRD